VANECIPRRTRLALVRPKLAPTKLLVVGAITILPMIGLMGSVILPLDSLNIFAPYWVAAGCAGLGWVGVSSFVQGQSRIVGWVAVAGLAFYVTFVVIIFGPLRESPSSFAPAKEVSAIKLVSFNVRKTNEHTARAAKWISAQSPDVIVLLEGNLAGTGLARLLRKNYPFQYDCRGDGRCSTVLLSRRPATAINYRATGDTENRKSLSSLTASFLMSGAAVSVTAVHLPRPWPLGEPSILAGQLSDATDIFDGHRIVAGDFNNPPWTFAMQNLAHDMRLTLASGAKRTWPAMLSVPAVLPLDQIYLGNCLQAMSVKTGPDLGSDHLPIIAELRMMTCDG
jgi:endonuclease/exonuclease/phosphatase (EEP) superfamily protein YafD